MADPAYPTSFVDTDTIPAVTGSTFTVPGTQATIQAAINAAAAANDALTHEIVLTAGVTYNEDLTLPNKGTGTTGWILVRTSNLAGIAAQNQRIVPATHAGAMPKIQTSALYGVETAPGAHHYRFIGIEFIRTGGSTNGSLLQLWNAGNSSLSTIPHHIVIDRCIGRNTIASKYILAFQNGTENAVIDSSLVLDPSSSGDASALWIFNGPGPFKAVNNDLAGQGETVFFGAAWYVTGYTAQDIEFRRNLVRAQPIAATPGKNLIEWKQGLRVWLQGNIFQDGAMNGQAYNVMMSPQDEGSAGLPNVDDIIWEYNLFRRLRACFALSGQGFGQTGVHMTRVAIRHNFIDGVGDYGGSGHQATYNNGTDQVTVDHNTFRNAGGDGVRFEGGAPNTNWIHRNNIIENDVQGTTNTGTAALNAHTTGRVFNKNVLAGSIATYTGADLTDNFFPATVTLNADGSLPAGSPYINAATDGTNIGADFTKVYDTPNGVGQFGSGANDFYAYDGQWPASAPSGTVMGSQRGVRLQGWQMGG